MKKIILSIIALILTAVLCSCALAEITELKMQKAEALEINVGGNAYKSWVNVSPNSFDDEKIEFVIENGDYASVEKGSTASGTLWFTVTALKPGKTQMYAQTTDGRVKSEIIEITVFDNAGGAGWSVLMDNDTILTLLKTTADSVMKDKNQVLYDEESNTFVMNVWQPGITQEAVQADEGALNKNNWADFKKEISDLSNYIKNAVEAAGSKADAMVNVLDDLNKDDTLLTILNGEVTFDISDALKD